MYTPMVPAAAVESPFAAIASSTRRRLLDLLKGGEKSVSALTEALSVSQPAVSQHLAALRDAGLVVERREGRFRFYGLNAAPLAEVMGWVRTYEEFWTGRLDALGRTLDEMK
jgi:DNA-binding transcriptional ArsR family regulator